MTGAKLGVMEVLVRHSGEVRHRSGVAVPFVLVSLHRALKYLTIVPFAISIIEHGLYPPSRTIRVMFDGAMACGRQKLRLFVF